MAKLLKNLSNSLSTITPKQARLNFNLSTLIAVIILLFEFEDCGPFQRLDNGKITERMPCAINLSYLEQLKQSQLAKNKDYCWINWKTVALKKKHETSSVPSQTCRRMNSWTFNSSLNNLNFYLIQMHFLLAQFTIRYSDMLSTPHTHIIIFTECDIGYIIFWTS